MYGPDEIVDASRTCSAPGLNYSQISRADRRLQGHAPTLGQHTGCRQRWSRRASWHLPAVRELPLSSSHAHGEFSYAYLLGPLPRRRNASRSHPRGVFRLRVSSTAAYPAHRRRMRGGASRSSCPRARSGMMRARAVTAWTSPSAFSKPLAVPLPPARPWNEAHTGRSCSSRGSARSSTCIRGASCAV